MVQVEASIESALLSGLANREDRRFLEDQEHQDVLVDQPYHHHLDLLEGPELRGVLDRLEVQAVQDNRQNLSLPSFLDCKQSKRHRDHPSGLVFREDLKVRRDHRSLSDPVDPGGLGRLEDR